jgi:hypothetical protein
MSTLMRFCVRLVDWYDTCLMKVMHATAHALNMLNSVENSNAWNSARDFDLSGFTFNNAYNFYLLI